MANAIKEKSIFYNAISIADAAMRAKYLLVACDDDQQLQQRVESLLNTAESNDSSWMQFQATNALALNDLENGVLLALVNENEALSLPCLSETGLQLDLQKLDPLLGQTLGHYRIISLLGAGGRGRVYLADDLRLERKIAIKTFPTETLGRQPERYLHEARLASKLDHPNICSIYDVGATAEFCYITMQYVAGQTLDEFIDDRPVPLDRLVRIALQITTALAESHRLGMIHRDIKPGNIMIDQRGHVRVLDFGLAALRNSPQLGNGCVGTPPYMSPEQIQGQPTDNRSDIFSLGVVLYHMSAGQVPFAGATPLELAQATIEQPHASLLNHQRNVPRELAALIDRALAKSPDDRYSSVEQIAADLRSLEKRLCSHSASAAPRFVQGGLLLACLLIAWLVGWSGLQELREKWARDQIPKIAELVRNQQNFEAYELATKANGYLPGDPKLTRLLLVVTDTVNVTSDPAGARVYLKRFLGDPSIKTPAHMSLIGTTPLQDVKIPRSDYVLRVEKEGYVPFQRTLSGAVIPDLEDLFVPASTEVKLVPREQAKPGMVWIPGGSCELTAWGRPTEEPVDLHDYWIDVCEVTNREYQEFVNAGGYDKQEYWPSKFTMDGDTLTWEQAMTTLKDSTGKPTPFGWAHGEFPLGKKDHPVTGISWYEASAYAKFRGKALPSIFQWEKAAKYQWKVTGSQSKTGVTLPWGLVQQSTKGKANFDGDGTMPVGSFEFGLSPYGCYDMAGNVSEWCLNETPEGFMMAGGSWNQPINLFGFYGRYPGSFSSNQIGFRCVLNEAAGDDGSGRDLPANCELNTFATVPQEKVEDWIRTFYDYDPNEPPPDARVEDRQETRDWVREKIAFTTFNHDRTFGYLYLPKHSSPPYQVIQVVPGGDVFFLNRPLDESIEREYGDLIRSGRAVFSVVLTGFAERPDQMKFAPKNHLPDFVMNRASLIKDIRRGLDVLLARDDINTDCIAFLQGSAGTVIMTLPAMEPRYSAVVLWGAGVRNRESLVHPAANPINFAPLISQPTLQIHGRYDEATRWEPEAKTLYNLLTCEKELVLLPCGHRPDPAKMADVVDSWLDRVWEPTLPNLGTSTGADKSNLNLHH